MPKAPTKKTAPAKGAKKPKDKKAAPGRGKAKKAAAPPGPPAKPPEVRSLVLSLITADPALQPRVGGSPDEVIEEYAEAVRAGAEFPPLVVYEEQGGDAEGGPKWWLSEGFTRHAAFVRAGKVMALCEVRQGTRQDALVNSCGSNRAHGLRRTNADKRRAVGLLLAEFPKWSDRKVADAAGVYHQLVADVRANGVVPAPKAEPKPEAEGDSLVDEVLRENPQWAADSGSAGGDQGLALVIRTDGSSALLRKLTGRGVRTVGELSAWVDREFAADGGMADQNGGGLFAAFCSLGASPRTASAAADAVRTFLRARDKAGPRFVVEGGNVPWEAEPGDDAPPGAMTWHVVDTAKKKPHERYCDEYPSEEEARAAAERYERKAAEGTFGQFTPPSSPAYPAPARPAPKAEPPRAEAPAPAEPADGALFENPPADQLGTPLVGPLAKLVPVFEAREAVRLANQSCGGLVAELTTLDREFPVGGFLARRPRIVAEIDRIADLLRREVAPHCVCPACGADDPGCPTCGGKGWLSRAAREAFDRDEPSVCRVPGRDALGAPVPPRLRDDFACEELIEDVRTLERIAFQLREGKGALPWLKPEALSALEDAARLVGDAVPYAVCASCEGAGCAACMTSGYHPQWSHDAGQNGGGA